MNRPSKREHSSGPRLPLRAALLWALTAVASFHIAHLVPLAGYAIVGFFLGLLNLTRLNNARHGFRWGIVLGWAVYVPHLLFFWSVFVPEGTQGGAGVIGAVAVFVLWSVLPIWLGVFLSLATWLRRWTSPKWWFLLIPACWTGIEYFRGELYPLKFTWLSAGYAFANATRVAPLSTLGMYGTGWLLILAVACVIALRTPSRRFFIVAGSTTAAVLLLLSTLSFNAKQGSREDLLPIGGVQLEFPSDRNILEHLDRLITEHPETDLCVLSEYTFDGPVPETVRNWCRDNARHLIAGGKDPLGTTNFYNTAFVVGPHGGIVFKQVKAVPIQFFRDGLPAPEQRLWDSPWGRLGLCVCYDLGYTRVTDELVRLGANAIIAPTMDVEGWGAYQHRLHARVTPIRAAEHGIPIFRLTSSGISQYVLPSGKVAASRPYPGQGEILAVSMTLNRTGRLPPDRWFAPLCVLVTGATAFVAAFVSARRRFFGGGCTPKPGLESEPANPPDGNPL